MSKAAFLYLVFPVVMAVLYFLSKALELPPGIEETGISRAFLKISLYIYSHVKGHIRSFSSEKIRMYLGTLEQRKDLEAAETEYFIRKISIVLLMASAGCFLAFMMAVSAAGSKKVSEDGSIERNEYGGRTYSIDLVASDAEGEELMEMEFPIEVRKYTKQEADILFEEASDLLEAQLLKDNDSLDEVSLDLDLVDKIEGYPFDISWKMDNYELIHLDGKLIEDNIPPLGEIVNLTAVYTYEGQKWQQLFCVQVVPRQLSPKEKAFKEIKKLVTKADEDSRESTHITLPETYEGKELFWSERVKDNSMMLLLLTLIGGAASYVLKDKELKKAMDDRSSQMLSDYPQFVSQIVLYMGAGMTVRNIFTKLSDGYVRKRNAGCEKKYLYEEVLRAKGQLMAGESEADVYERFGLRCRGQQYTRLSSLLSQNLRKGNSELLKLLQEESKRAFDERMDRVRKAGEEAGTKLLLPMIIMLVIVMVIIMIPAYMAF